MPTPQTAPRPAGALRRGTIIAAILAVGLLLRLANWTEVFRPWGIAFADGDCYARMSRVELVMAHPGTIVRAHAFENFPIGTRPHTTAPLDYLLALGAWLLQPVAGGNARDLAGAWLGPACFLAVLGSLVGWVRRLGWPFGWWAGPLLFALSPISVQGTILGRPDHQALLLVLVLFALVADALLVREGGERHAWTGGIAWGVALWVSLYEPVILLLLARGCAAALLCGQQRGRLLAISGLATGGVLLIALALEGWRIDLRWMAGPDAALFARWSARIGELASQTPWSPTMLGWAGGFLLLAPAAVWQARRERSRAVLGGGIGLAALVALTCWQARWGYFLVLGIAMVLPLASLRLPEPHHGRVGRLLLSVSLLPVATAALGVFPLLSLRRAAHAARADALHDLALEIRRDAAEFPAGRHGILAPWWLCPPLAYWSGQPAIAGSSHQSIAGALDAEKFFASGTDAEAFALVQRRRVRWIVTDEPEHLREAAIFPERFQPRSLALRLARGRADLPGFLAIPEREMARPYDSTLSLFRVRTEYLAP